MKMSDIIVGALFAFAANLTSGERLILSREDDTAPLVERLKDFCKTNGLDIDNPDIHWKSKLGIG